MKRKAEVVLIVILSFWVVAAFIATEKVYRVVKNGECGKNRILVPVVLDQDCKPNILLRRCDQASDPIDVNCSIRLKESKGE